MFLRNVRFYRSLVMSKHQFLTMCKNLELYYYKELDWGRRTMGAGATWHRWDRFLVDIFDLILEDRDVSGICVVEVGNPEQGRTTCTMLTDARDFANYVLDEYGDVEIEEEI